MIFQNFPMIDVKKNYNKAVQWTARAGALLKACGKLKLIVFLKGQWKPWLLTDRQRYVPVKNMKVYA